MSTNENVLEREGFERPNVKEDNNKIVSMRAYIEWMRPFPLSKLNDESKKDFIKDNPYLKKSGVCFLYWNKTNSTDYDSIKWEEYREMIMSKDTIYIGKSGREKLMVRATKHRKSLLDLPGVAPGKKMREICKDMRDEHGEKVTDHVFFICGVVKDNVLPHLLEPIFGERYSKANNGQLPKGNTQRFF